MSMNAAAYSVPSNRERLLLWFTLLQALDCLTTLAVFSRGGSELNPVILQVMRYTGVVPAIILCKALLVWLTWRYVQRTQILHIGIAIYGIVVAWNLALFAAAR